MPEQLSTQRQKSIITAARRRFSHYGYAKTTMDEIAVDVSMGKASLYYYFATKESLFAAVVASEQDEFIAFIRKLSQAEGSAAERIRRYAERRLQFFSRSLVLSRFSIQTFMNMPKQISEQYRTFVREELAFLQHMLESGRRSHEFAIDSTQDVAATLLHILQGLRLRAFKAGFSGGIEGKEFRELKRDTMLAIDMILRGLRREPHTYSDVLQQKRKHNEHS